MKKILLISLLLSLNSSIYSQWIKLSCPDEYPITHMSRYGDTLFLGNGNASNYLSTDHGDNWTRFSSQSFISGILYSMWFSGNRILAGTTEGIYLSEDNGQSFTLQQQADRINCFLNYQSKLLAGNISVYLGYWGPPLYMSSDQGVNWTISGSGLPVNVHRIFCLEEYNGMLIAGTDNGVFYTDDIDSGWNHVTGIYYPNVYALLKVGNRLYCGTNHGLYYTDEITSDLQLCQNGMAGDEYITSLAQVDGHLFVGCHWGDGVFLLRNFENHFVHLTGLSNPQVLRLCIDDNYVYAGTYAEEYSLLGGVYRQELSTIVAIKEVNPPVPFRVLGNPVTDMLMVDFEEQVKEGILTIYYPDGREIRNCKILNCSAEVNMTGLSAGLYLGQVFCNEKYYPFKFIKI